MSGWNREKVLFALALLVLIGSIVHSAGSFLAEDPAAIQLSEPRAATQGAVGGAVAIEWFAGGAGSIRDPFQAKSDWRPARPDALPPPPIDPLARRIPLPAPVARTPRAWPGLEEEPPPVASEDPTATGTGSTPPANGGGR